MNTFIEAVTESESVTRVNQKMSREIVVSAQLFTNCEFISRILLLAT